LTGLQTTFYWDLERLTVGNSKSKKILRHPMKTQYALHFIMVLLKMLYLLMMMVLLIFGILKMVNSCQGSKETIKVKSLRLQQDVLTPLSEDLLQQIKLVQ